MRNLLDAVLSLNTSLVGGAGHRPRSARHRSVECARWRLMPARVLLALTICAVAPALLADIPALPVLTLYQFNGPLRIPYYQIGAGGPGAVAGHLTQGSSVIPCLVVRNGRALTDDSGTPYVGFEVVVDSATAGPEATETFRQALARQDGLRVANHHCTSDVRHVMNARHLHPLTRAPFFDPPPKAASSTSEQQNESRSELDSLVREFHESQECAQVGTRLLGRRDALARAWDDFIARKTPGADATILARAKHLDYAMRTTIYEGHLDRGCSAYGACERNVVLLSIRNRAVGQCVKRQGCRFPGDFQGVSSDPSQYNIWDAYLTQISGLTACYLRADLANERSYQRLQQIYTQTIPDAERILYGSNAVLAAVFPETPLSDVTELRHYYHPPAMGKCFPQKDRIEFMTGAVAEKDGQFALIVNSRIEVGERIGDGYAFKEFRFDHTPDGDQLRVIDNYPDFVVDGRKVSLKSGHNCTPYGVSRSCRFNPVNRYRTIPNWLEAGQPLALTCRIIETGERCDVQPSERKVQVGGPCDTEMMPVTRVR